MLYKLVVMGSSNVGKSALTIQLVDDVFVPIYDPTFEDSYSTHIVVDGEDCELDILDTTGSEAYQTWRHKFMRWGEGFLCVYSVNDIKSFVDVNTFREQLHKVKGTNFVPLVLVANKMDLTEVLVPRALGLETARSFKVPFVETSAKTGEGVRHAFEVLIREIRWSQNREILIDSEPVQGCGFRHCTIL